jgi:hypothetical protein
VVEHVEIFEEGLLGVDGQRTHLAAAGHLGDPQLLVGQRLGLEELGDALPALHLDQQRAPPVRGQAQGQGRGDAGLAGAALAGHHMQSCRPSADVLAHGLNGTASGQPATSQTSQPVLRITVNSRSCDDDFSSAVDMVSSTETSARSSELSETFGSAQRKTGSV